MRIGKLIRNILISIGALLVLAIAGGVAYTWYVGQAGVENTSAVAAPVEVQSVTPLQHVQPASNAKIGASVQSLTSPVAPGSNVSLTIKTLPDAECTITVVYNKVASTDSGLSMKIADEFGMASWTWTVEESVPLGTWPAKVTCVLGKQSAVVQADLVVAQPKN